VEIRPIFHANVLIAQRASANGAEPSVFLGTNYSNFYRIFLVIYSHLRIKYLQPNTNSPIHTPNPLLYIFLAHPTFFIPASPHPHHHLYLAIGPSVMLLTSSISPLTTSVANYITEYCIPPQPSVNQNSTLSHYVVRQHTPRQYIVIHMLLFFIHFFNSKDCNRCHSKIVTVVIPFPHLRSVDSLHFFLE